MAKTIIGLFDDFPEAQDVMQAMVDHGVPRAHVSVIVHQDQASAPEPASVWASRTLSIPGIGPVLAIGPVAAALSGTGGDVAGEDLISVLKDRGVPANEVQFYAEGVRRGSALVAVDIDEASAEQVMEVMGRYATVDLETRTAQWRQAGWTGFDPNAGPYLAPKSAREYEAADQC